MLDAQFLKWLPENLHGKLSNATLRSRISGKILEKDLTLLKNTVPLESKLVVTRVSILETRDSRLQTRNFRILSFNTRLESFGTKVSSREM